MTYLSLTKLRRSSGTAGFFCALWDRRTSDPWFFFKGVYDKSRNQDSCKYDMDQVRKKIDGNSQHAFSAALYGGDRFQCLRFSAEGSHRNVMQYQRPG